MAKRHRRRTSPQDLPGPSSPSASGCTHTTSSPSCNEQPPSPIPIPKAAPSPPPTPPPPNSTWLGRDVRPWANLTKTVESLPEEAISMPTRSPSPDRCATPVSVQPPACCTPPRSPSVVSESTELSGDSGVLLRRPCSKSSHVTSISIPPSVGSTRVCPLPQPSFCLPLLPCHAPIPTRKISPLDSFCSKSTSTRHSRFYFTDDLVTLNVDGCLFRVHKGFLERESVYFRKLFLKETGRGNSDDSAIELPQVTVAAFETLLRFVYFGTHELCSYPVEDWISLLAASTLLSFPRIRERALSELESETSCLDAVDRLLLADRYDIDRWRAPAYVQLCVRDRPLQESEATLLGVKVTSQLAEIRERVLLEMLSEYQRPARADKVGIRVASKPTRDVHRVEQLVDEVFWPHEVPISCRA